MPRTTYRCIGATRAVLCAALLVMACVVSPRAQDVTVTAELSASTVPVGNDVVLTLAVEGKARGVNPELPPLDDFTVMESGTSQSFQFVNGRMSSSIIYTYVLIPRAEGEFTIGSIVVKVDDKQYKTSPLKLSVTAAASTVPPAQIPSQSGGDVPPPGAAGSADDGSIFIRATVDRDTVYVNQQVTWSLGYYTDGRVALMRSPNYTPPDAEGFWVEDLPPQSKYYTQHQGRQYLVNEIKRGYFPTSPGLYRVGPARVDIVVDDYRSNRGNLIDDFFSRSRGLGRQHTLQTEEREIVVLPLPVKSQPAGFTGIVARDMHVSLSADKQVSRVGEPINVTIEVEGAGNMRTIPSPTLAVKGFKVYESGSSSDTFKKDYVVTGRRRYEFVVVPQEEGRHTIPVVQMPYFDPVQRRYLRAASHPVTLDIHPGDGEDGRRVIYAGSGNDIEVINRDIRFIHPVPSSVALSAPGRGAGAGWIALHAGPLLALLATIVVESRRRRLAGNVGFARATRALRAALNRMDNAAGGTGVDAWTALSDALAGYFADRLNVSRAGLTQDDLDSTLADRGAVADIRADVRQLLSRCDAARFAASGGDAEDLRASIDAGRALVRRLEREVKW